MWSEFTVPEKSVWLEKLQREASKTLGPEVDAASALVSKSPDGVTYEPLYLRSSVPPCAPGWQATRIVQPLDPADPQIAAVVKAALAHDCTDFSLSQARPDVYRQLREKYPQARWWLAGAPDSSWPAPHAWEIDALDLPASLDGPLVLSTRSVRERGGSIATELWVGLAALVELQRRGVALAGIGWATAFSPRILLEAAKCAAIRRLWEKFCTAAGIAAAPLHLHGAQASFYTARLDQPSNLLRSTAAAWVAAVGGCETLRLQPYSQDPQAAHLARNQLYVLLQEGALQKVADPLAGAYALEAWSEQLARGAWKMMREVEAAGGLMRFIAEGRLEAILEHERQEQAARVDVDKQVLVGVTRYVPVGPSADMAPAGDPARLAAPYESLREAFAVRFPDRSKAAALVLVGSQAKLSARLDFARGFLALAGLEPRLQGPPSPSEEPVVVLCSADRDHAEWIPRLLAALKPGQVLVVAGQPDVPGDYLKIYKGAARRQVLQSILKAVAL